MQSADAPAAASVSPILRILQSRAFCAALCFLSFCAVGIFVQLCAADTELFSVTSLCFDALWALLLSAVLLCVPQRLSRFLYLVLYLLFLLYGVAQIIYNALFSKLFPLTAVTGIKEGAGYLSSIFSYITPAQYLLFFLLLILGTCVFFFLRQCPAQKKLVRILAVPVSLSCMVLGQLFLPRLLGEPITVAVWNTFENPRFYYDSAADSKKTLSVAGFYQYLGLDFYRSFLQKDATEKNLDIASAFFEDYPGEQTENEYTGIFRGKNLVLVMMESMDYPALANENTKNLPHALENGIWFSNYYAPIFGNGATFANEFCLNTGLFAPSDGTAPYAYAQNQYPQSLPNLFSAAGYSANSFHENYAWFYSRGTMHRAFGYEDYHSYHDYGADDAAAVIDTYLTDTPTLLADVLPYAQEKPFFSFVITYSAHLGYAPDSELVPYALERYVSAEQPLGDGAEDAEILRAKARITDDMLGRLIEAADEDTVFAFVTDHYAYGLSASTLLAEKGSGTWALQQRVPFVLYGKAADFPKRTVEKYCSSADVLPTLANLFGLRLPVSVPGHDIFDEAYEGYVIFSNYTFCSEYGYYQDGMLYPADEEDAGYALADLLPPQDEQDAKEQTAAAEENTAAATAELPTAAEERTQAPQEVQSAAEDEKPREPGGDETGPHSAVLLSLAEQAQRLVPYLWRRIEANDAILAADFYQTPAVAPHGKKATGPLPTPPTRLFQ